MAYVLNSNAREIIDLGRYERAYSHSRSKELRTCHGKAGQAFSGCRIPAVASSSLLPSLPIRSGVGELHCMSGIKVIVHCDAGLDWLERSGQSLVRLKDEHKVFVTGRRQSERDDALC